MSQLHLIAKPIISEKSMSQAATGKYLFEVPKSANKIEIARTVSHDFKVTVRDVNVMINKGKTKMLRGIKGRRSDTKRAIVTVKSGDTIKAFEIQEETK